MFSTPYGTGSPEFGFARTGNRQGHAQRRHNEWMTLNEELDRIFAGRDRNNMQPTIDALVPILDRHPTNARVLYELGGAYDTAGMEQTAGSFYEQALRAGLSGDPLRRCYLQYGSTLRNLGEFDRSAEVFERARQEFPDSPSLAVFQAITFHAAGLFGEAVASLLEAVADGVDSPDMERYKPAIRGNAACIRSMVTDSPSVAQNDDRYETTGLARPRSSRPDVLAEDQSFVAALAGRRPTGITGAGAGVGIPAAPGNTP
ncbi:tetratricopeptide repeat protein [Paeniglutamicibacter sp. NPDC091659]|uniref:tetratricopeptide repeat protein n=1 Tax=Paeniglutamicibacter sp. NPDC091659 TaxID=3364389 RepID=UPI00381DED6A